MVAFPNSHPAHDVAVMKPEAAELHAAYKPDVAKNFDFYCQRVDLCWSKAIAGIAAMGYLLCEARMNLTPSEWRRLIEEHCPFDYTVACRLMQIAQSQRVTDEKTAKLLPASWDKLYQLMKLEEVIFRDGIERGVIHPKMTGKDITDLKETWNKAHKTAASNESVAVGGEQISDTKSEEDGEPAISPSPVAEPSAPKPETKKAAVRAAAKNTGLRVVDKNTSAAAVGAESVIDLEPPPPPAPVRNRLAIIISREVADQHGADLNNLKDELVTLVKRYSFVGAVELEVAA